MPALNPIRLVDPITYTDAMLIASNVPESETLWSSATTYAAGDLRRVAHTIYESLQGGNLNHDPVTDSALATPTWWRRAYSSNRWRALDTSYSSQTTQASSITYQIRPGRTVTTLALLNLVGTQARVYMIDPTDGTVYDKTVEIVEHIKTASFYEFAFSPVTYVSQVLLTDLPAYSTADIYVEVTGTGTVALGVLLMGFAYDLGVDIHEGARFGTQDYSRKGTDSYGNTDLQRRGNAAWMVTECRIDMDAIDGANRLLRNLLGRPFLAISHEPVAALSVYGFIQEYEWTARPDLAANLNLRVTGMT